MGLTRVSVVAYRREDGMSDDADIIIFSLLLKVPDGLMTNTV